MRAADVNQYPEVIALLNFIGASEEEALSALLSAFGPPQPGALASAWKKNLAFGNSSPTTKEFWQLFVDAGFRCGTCKSQLRLTVDHIDGNAKNHAMANLNVLCFKCNRAKVGKPSSSERANVALFRAAYSFLRETGSIPRNKEIAKRAGVAVSGATYLLKFLRFIHANSTPGSLSNSAPDNDDLEESEGLEGEDVEDITELEEETLD